MNNIDMNDAIMVSVCCIVYNHEKYLRQCLDGFMMQKTDFKFEVLIHDDASTDGSADIIREYEQKYPDIIKPIYQKENKFSKGVKISQTYLYPQARGKYIALCEGDDYWIDNFKLQKQFNILESNKDCSICVHGVQGIDENGTPNNLIFPKVDLNDGIIENGDFLKMAMEHNFHTNSYFFRNMREYYINPPDFVRIAPVGDITTLLFFAANGTCYFINDIMSIYRCNSINGWSSRYKSSSIVDKINLQYRLLEMYRAYQKYDKSDNSFCNYAIWKNEFKIFHYEGKFRKMIRKEYKPFWFSELSVKARFKVIAGLLFPEIVKTLQFKRWGNYEDVNKQN